MRVAIRVISLADSDRREGISKQFERLDAEWDFFDACTTPPPLPYCPERIKWTRGRTLTAGELGCFASHYLLWQSLASSTEHDAMWIFEDDVLVDCNFFNKLLQHLLNVRQFDYLRFYSKLPVPMDYLDKVLGRHVVRLRAQAFGTQGYMITRRGAEKLLQSVIRVDRPIDDEMDRFWVHDVPVYALFPSPLIELDLGSTIEDSRRKLAQLSRKDLCLRLMFRAREKTMRGIWNASFDAKHGVARFQRWVRGLTTK